MQTLVIGDIHGCYHEMLDLLDKAGLSDDDHIIAIGDIVNRGPENERVLEFFRTQDSQRVRSILGNHEHKHIRAHKGESRPSLSTLLTRWELDDRYDDAIAYMQTMPLYLDLPDALLVHAFFEPDIPIEKQQTRVIVGTKGAEKYLAKHYKRPWYEFYNGDKPLIVGHRDIDETQTPFVYRDRVFAIDTGCVYGGTLTGVLLPSFKVITVPARRDHWGRVREYYANLSELTTVR